MNLKVAKINTTTDESDYGSKENKDNIKSTTESFKLGYKGKAVYIHKSPFGVSLVSSKLR